MGVGGRFGRREVRTGKEDNCCRMMGHLCVKGSTGRRVIFPDNSSRAWLTSLMGVSKYLDCNSLMVVE